MPINCVFLVQRANRSSMFSPPPVNKKPAEEKHRHTMLSASKASPNKSAGEEDPPFRPSVLSIRRINVRWVALSLNTFRTAFNTNGQILYYDKLNTLLWQVNSHCCYTFRFLSHYSIESWGGHKLTKSIERLLNMNDGNRDINNISVWIAAPDAIDRRLAVGYRYKFTGVRRGNSVVVSRRNGICCSG